VESDKLHWFKPDDAFTARDAGEIELAPPQWVTLLWLRDHGTVAEVLAAAEDADPIDFTPRFHFIEGGGAICVYREDVAYDDVAQLDAPGARHRLYLNEAAWEYVNEPA